MKYRSYTTNNNCQIVRAGYTRHTQALNTLPVERDARSVAKHREVRAFDYKTSRYKSEAYGHSVAILINPRGVTVSPSTA
jgi:hypothetical protein